MEVPPLQPSKPAGPASTQTNKLSVPATKSSRPVSLVHTVAETLGMPAEEIQLFDSFVDLGGDDVQAEELAEKCEDHGIALETEDVMQCQTLAELQTRMRPLSPVAEDPAEMLIASSARISAVGSRSYSPNSNTSGEEAPGLSESVASRSSTSGSPPTSSHSMPQMQPNLGIPEELEDLIMSNHRVGAGCLLIPRTGPFEHRLIAVFTTKNLKAPKPSYSLSSSPPAEDSSDISLPSDDEANTESCRRHVQELRMTVQEWGSDYPRPEIWITLKTVALTDDGDVDIGKTRAWVEGLGHEDEQRIMALQIVERRRRPAAAAAVPQQSNNNETTNTPVEEDDRGQQQPEPTTVTPGAEHSHSAADDVSVSSPDEDADVEVLGQAPLLDMVSSEDDSRPVSNVSGSDELSAGRGPERLSTMWRDDSEDELAEGQDVAGRGAIDEEDEGASDESDVANEDDDEVDVDDEEDDDIPSDEGTVTTAKAVTIKPFTQTAEMPTEEINNVEFFPLSPMQQLYFRTSMHRSSQMSAITAPSFRFTQSILLQVNSKVRLADVESAVETLVNRHSMLRARFLLTGEGWAQVIVPRSKTSYRFQHHALKPGEDAVIAVIEQAQASLNVTTGPVFAVDHMRLKDGKRLLHLVAHHLVVDLKSWRVIMHDLDELLQHGTLLSQKSIPFPNWIDYQSYELNQGLLDPALPFDIVPTDMDYWGLDQQPNCYGDTEQLHFALPNDLTKILQTSAVDLLRAEASDVYLAALLLSFCQTFPDRDAPTMWKQEHGRDGHSKPEFNVNDTVGWFTTLCPIHVASDSRTDLIHLLKQMKDTRKAIPRNGVPFFISEFSASGSSDPFTMIPVEIMFNCVDTLQELPRNGGVLEPVAAPDGDIKSLTSDIGPDVGRIAIFEVSVVIDSSGTRVETYYNKHAKHASKMEAWMHNYEHIILEAIGRLRVMEPELTLSDTPLLDATQAGLAKLTSERLATVGLDSVRSIETVYPVNPAQQEILIAQGQDQDSFHLHSIYELVSTDDQRTNSARLCKAWETIVAAHPALRSIFIDSVSKDGLFDQVVLKKISPSMLFIDDSGNPEQALASLPAMRTAPAQPRHRLSVCVTSKKSFVRIDASQAICDARSIHNLMSQLRQVYAGENFELNDALIPTYLQQMASTDTAYSARVWNLSLEGASPCHYPKLSLFSEPRLQASSFELEITRGELVGFCNENKIDPLCVIQLAWAIVLRASVGTDRVTFGSQLSGRDDELLPGIGDAIGSYATLLPCTVDWSGHNTVSQCLKNLQDLSHSAQQHQALTMTDIHHAMGLTSSDLFNTCLSFQDAHSEEKKPGGFSTSLVTSARTSNCDVSLSVVFIQSSLHLNISYRYLTETQAHNTVSTFENALRVVLDSTSRYVSELDLFTDRDYAQLVVQDWDSGEKAEKVDACVHQLALQHSHSRPGAMAICSWDGDFTYRQLETYVNRLSSYLINIGIQAGSYVPIVLEKNKWAPVIMLSILRAGAAFISLDSQDIVTVELTVAQLSPEHVIATENAYKTLKTLPVSTVVVNDAFFSSTLRQSTDWLPTITPDHGACVFYTAAKGKGVASRNIFFTHASLCTAFSVQGAAFGIHEASRVLQLSAFNMDIALVEVLATLCYGGCVCVPASNERLHNLGGAIARMGVTWSYMTAILARRIDPAEVPTLQTLCFRTRSLDEDTYAPWLENRNVLLAYGAPDVCPLGVAVTEVSMSRESTIIPPPLMGKFWILNPEDPRKLMPVGTVGELGIDSPVITPHRFIVGQPLIAAPSNAATQEFIDRPRARYLKTGHRVRYLEGGQIQFLSSMRDEVVIGGSTVVVGDIELHIRRCLGRGIDVCVDAVTTADGIQTLVAFLELGSQFEGPTDPDQLSLPMKERAFKAKKMVESYMANPRLCPDRIPQHHVPSVFVPLRRLPISTSLKVNRRKLGRMIATLPYTKLADMSSVPNPQEIQQTILEQKPLPMTQVEELMRRVWARVLDMVPIDVKGNNSFFSLGGDAHLATELVVACRRAGFTVSIWDILQGATLTEVCQSIATSEISFHETRPPGELKLNAMALHRMAGFDEKFIKEVLAPQLKVNWRDIHDVSEASSHQIRSLEMAMYNERSGISCLVLDFNGPVRYQTLEVACETLSRVHPILRTAFAIHDRRAYQVLLDSFKPAFQRYPCPQRRLNGVCAHVVEQDQALEFALNYPVTKFNFFDAGDQSKLAIRLSPALIDDATVALLVQDLIALYENLSNVPRKWTFFDYMRAAQAVNYRDGIDFWKGQLEGAKMTKMVSPRTPWGPNVEVIKISEDIQINSLNSYGVGFDTVLKAAWSTVLATLSGSSDVLFGELIHGYSIPVPDNVDMSTIVGPMTNTIPIRVGFPAAHSTPLDLMQYVQGQRLCSRPFESMGILELVQRCTDWAYWTRFSTVVHHRSQAPVDGSTTLNMGDTTFTYNLKKPDAQDRPDVFVCSTMDGSRNVNISLEFPENRICRRDAEGIMKLLITALNLMTDYDTINKPMLPSSNDLSRITAKIPLPLPEPEKKDTVGHLITSDQRSALQSLIYSSWIEILDPTPLGVPEAQIYKASFYDLWGSLLPAHCFAQHLNRELRTLKMPGANKIQVTAEELVENPSMMEQSELVVRKMRDSGAIPGSAGSTGVASASLPIRRRTFGNSHSGHHKQNSQPSISSIWAPAGAGAAGRPESPGPQADWKTTIKLRGQESRANMKSLSTRAGSFLKKHKVSLSGGSGGGSGNVELGAPSTIPEHVVVPTGDGQRNSGVFRSKSVDAVDSRLRASMYQSNIPFSDFYDNGDSGAGLASTSNGEKRNAKVVDSNKDVFEIGTSAIDFAVNPPAAKAESTTDSPVSSASAPQLPVALSNAPHMVSRIIEEDEEEEIEQMMKANGLRKSYLQTQTPDEDEPHEELASLDELKETIIKIRAPPEIEQIYQEGGQKQADAASDTASRLDVSPLHLQGKFESVHEEEEPVFQRSTLRTGPSIRKAPSRENWTGKSMFFDDED